MQDTQNAQTAIMGKPSVGKTTLVNALIGRNDCPVGPLRTTASPIRWVMDREKAERNVFTVRSKKTGNRDLSIQAFANFTADAGPVDVDELWVYSEPRSFLKNVSLIDLPGIDFPGIDSVALDHNGVVKDFFISNDVDIIVHVIDNPNAISDLDTFIEENGNELLLPRQRITVPTKIDANIDWETSSPESVMDEAVQRCQVHLNQQGTSVLHKCVGCFGSVALAAELWEDRFLAKLLDSARRSDVGQLSKMNLTDIVDPAIIEEGNLAMRGPSDSGSKPAYPVIKFATEIIVREGIRRPQVLRERLLNLSGINTLRDVLENIAASPLIQTRRDALPHLVQSQTELLHLEKNSEQTRQLTQEAACLLKKQAQLGEVQASRFFADSHEYLHTHLFDQAEKRRSLRQDLISVRSDYMGRASELANEGHQIRKRVWWKFDTIRKICSHLKSYLKSGLQKVNRFVRRRKKTRW